MKTVKFLVVFAAFLLMATIIIDFVFMLDVSNPNKKIGAYVGLGAMAVLMVVLLVLRIPEKKLRKMEVKIEEKDKEIGRLQRALGEANDIINIVPTEEEDVRM